jgi:hypothetical protein
MQRKPTQLTHGNRCTRAAYHRALKEQPFTPGAPHNPIVQRRFQIARGIAHHRGHVWELTYDDYAALLERPCYYCGGILFRSGTGLDQLVPGSGYTVSNVVPCCWICNDVKSNVFTPDEMRELGLVIGRIRANWPESRLSRPRLKER